MKKFTCKEMGGPCDLVFEGETMEEVAGKGGQHIMATDDEVHKPMRDQMASGTEKGKEEWFAWFKGLWDAKADTNSQRGFVGPVAVGIIAVIVVVVIMFGYYVQNRPETVNNITPQENTILEKENTLKENDGTMIEKKTTETTDSGEQATTKPGVYEAYSAEKIALAETENVVLFFKANWCPTCRAVDADIKANVSKIHSKLNILEVNYDTATELKQKYGVTYQHTFVQVDANGNMLKKWTGSPTLAALAAEVK